MLRKALVVIIVLLVISFAINCSAINNNFFGVEFYSIEMKNLGFVREKAQNELKILELSSFPVKIKTISIDGNDDQWIGSIDLLDNKKIKIGFTHKIALMVSRNDNLIEIIIPNIPIPKKLHVVLGEDAVYAFFKK